MTVRGLRQDEITKERNRAWSEKNPWPALMTRCRHAWYYPFMRVCEELFEGCAIPPLEAPDDDGDRDDPIVVAHDAANPIGAAVSVGGYTLYECSPPEADATILRACRAAGKPVQLVTTEPYIYDHAWQTFGFSRIECAELLDVRDGTLYVYSVSGCCADGPLAGRLAVRFSERAHDGNGPTMTHIVGDPCQLVRV